MMMSRVVRAVFAAAVVAGCGSVWAATVHVAKHGNDLEGDGSAARPYATVQKGADMAAEGDVIRIAGGVYDESVTLHTFRHVSGSWNDDFTAQDLRDGRTVIRSTATSKPAISIPSEAGTNAIDGVTLTGGNSGLQSRASGGSNDKNDYNMSLTRLIVTNNVNGLDFNGGFNGANMISCLVANNSGKGFYHSANHGTVSFALNCTFVSNGEGLSRSGTWMTAVRARNCIFSKNTTAIHTTTDFSKFYVDRSIFHGNGVREKWDQGTQSNWSPVRYIAGILYGDPKLGEDFAPQAGSAAIGRGLDSTVARKYEGTTVLAGIPVIETDVYGTPFDGTDLGCVKAAVAAPPRLDDVYVATTGDDANSGVDAEHPKRSINNAVALLADGGTCHVADGTYVEAVALGVTNMTLVGESVAGTIIRSETGLDATTKDFAVGLLAPGAVVSNLTCTGSGAGVLTSQSVWEVNDTKAVRTILLGNCRGYVHAGSTRANCNLLISHSQIRDSISHGVYTFNVIRMDNVLIADSGTCGIYSDTHNNAGSIYLNNITVTGSGTYGYYFNGSYSPGVYCYNSIFEGNKTQGVYEGKSGFHAYKCCFFGNGNDNVNTGVKDENVDKVPSCIYVDPLVDQTATLRGHLGAGSPCAQTGGDYSAITQAPSTSDLDYMKRLTDKMDIGCYISPETMEDLAGDGYHILNVEGTPNGYGTVVPAYGRQLLADGPLRLDVRGTLYTDEVDGVRASRVVEGTEIAEGVRAAYLGYAYAEDGAVAPTYASDTAEYLDVAFAANATMTWRWDFQDRVVVDAGAKGCTVTVNGSEPAQCVTKWVTRGAPVRVTFTPSADWTFDRWTGDLVTGLDERGLTIEWTSDRPRTLTSAVKAVHYVATTGSDETGTGERATPWRTIGHAIASDKVKPGEVINVQAGTYAESVTNGAAFGGKGQITLKGGYDADWQFAPATAEVVVTPPAGLEKQVPCLWFDTVSNTVQNITFRGGSAGIVGATSSGGDKSAATHHTFGCIKVIGCANGIDFTACKYGLALTASLIAGNDGFGFSHGKANGGCDYVYNCTFAANGGTAVERNVASLGAGTFHNCVFDRNGCHYHQKSTSQSDTLHNCCFGPATDRLARQVSGERRVGFTEKFMVTDPLLDENYRPTQESPFLGDGVSLLYDANAPFGTDLDGTLWGGTWDYGCYKFAGAASAKRDELYVSDTGDDANDGLTSATAKRTIGGAIAHAAEGATIHVAPGVYEPGNSVWVKNLTIEGAGALVTKVVGGAPVTTSCECPLYGFQFWSSGAVVSGFGVSGTCDGMIVPDENYGKKNTVRDCRFEFCRYGVRLVGVTNDDTSSGNWHRIDRCVMADNQVYGVQAGDTVWVTSSYIARNGSIGYYGSAGNRHDTCWIVNTTFRDNPKTAIETVSSWADTHHFINCIVSGSTTGAKRTGERYSGGIYPRASCFYGNETDFNKVYDESAPLDAKGGIYPQAGVMLGVDPVYKAYGEWEIDGSSPCLGAGIDPTTVDNFPAAAKPERYLDGTPIKYRAGRIAIGCATVRRGLQVIVR